MEKRFTPAWQKSSNVDIPNAVGLTSSVTSTLSDRFTRLETVSRITAIVEGWARLGVPPPKNTEVMLQMETQENIEGARWKLQTILNNYISPYLDTWLRRSNVSVSRWRHSVMMWLLFSLGMYLLKLQ